MLGNRIVLCCDYFLCLLAKFPKSMSLIFLSRDILTAIICIEFGHQFCDIILDFYWVVVTIFDSKFCDILLESPICNVDHVVLI